MELVKTLPYEGAERIEIKVESPLRFFRNMLPVLPDLEDDEFMEICDRLFDQDEESFEIPIYFDFDNDQSEEDLDESDETDEPVAILIFEGNKVYVDNIFVEQKEKIMSLTKELGEGEVVKSRPLTQADWKKRLELLNELNDSELN